MVKIHINISQTENKKLKRTKNYMNQESINDIFPFSLFY